MIRRIAAGLALVVACAAPAHACPEPSETLLFHSCWGEARASVLLLPEDSVSDAPEKGRRLIVTGAYTGREPRAEGRPNPVGFFMRDGELVNQNMARMDGLLIIDGEGSLRLVDRGAAALDGKTYDLRDLGPRARFREKTSALGLDILQSHLLIIDGEPDVAEQSDAPRFRRRLVFTDDDGWGVWQSTGAITLYDAAEQLEAEHAPRMALNLDMGSYDFCLAAEDGIERGCGVLGRGQTDKLSNLLVFELE